MVYRAPTRACMPDWRSRGMNELANVTLVINGQTHTLQLESRRTLLECHLYFARPVTFLSCADIESTGPAAQATQHVEAPLNGICYPSQNSEIAF